MNRLAREQSPYLLQHAHNPVDWYPWGDEAFTRSRNENKPIFLSIGYSTCHWCHVMEHESFESQEIADLLNREFISVKVDREERPDVDRVYMAFVQATTGAGGWPMSVWLTPTLQPFYGGTYFPPASQWGRPGFREVLTEIARAWREDQSQVVESAGQITARLAEMARPETDSGGAVPGEEALQNTLRQFKSTFDRRRGGFGDAPKFPRPSELLFLLREYARASDDEARDMVAMTLRAMALGGMRDHIGGGFHRYSVDGNWRVPHFEKMLYDQAQLVLAYLETAQATDDPFFAQIAEDTLLYVRREMTDEGGGFYSAEDADSVPPEQASDPHPRKSEGAFYIWPLAEVRELLGEDSRAFELRYGLLAEGNAAVDPHNEFTGRNLLYTARGIGEIAKELGRAPQDVANALMQARITLFEARSRRPRPHLDDKVLTGWNGLMIAAFARASRVMPSQLTQGQPASSADKHLEAARRAAHFLKGTMWDGDLLLRRYRKGEAAIAAYAEDYAFLIFGILELFQADGNPGWLEWARALQQAQDRRFWDASDGGWYSTTGDDPSVLVRMKEEYDGAEPSASGVGAWNLLTLAHLTGEPSYEERAKQVFAAFSTRLTSLGRALPFMASALSMAHAAPEQIVVVGPSDAPATASLWQAANTPYRPFTSLIPITPGETQDALALHLPWIASMTMRDGTPVAYVCRNFTCEAPTTDPDTLRQ
jgi:uncharacterized protein YyaL (SSP411 family)